MSEMLQEFVDSGNQTLRVDRAAGVIRGVKLLGLRSRNGRRYQESALADAVGLYEGAKVNVNHPKGHPLSPRDYQDRLGVISGVQFRPGDGLFGDLHFNPKHTLSEQLMWDAEHASHNVGLSHNVMARALREGDETIVDAITKVQSIDLVADPATTRGLFEQETAAAPDSPPVALDWDTITIEQLEVHRPDLLDELRRDQAGKFAEVRNQLDQLSAREAVAQRRARVVELLQEHGLPLPDCVDAAARQVVSESFVQTLMNASNDEALKRLVEERAALVRNATRWNGETRRFHTRPVSRDQSVAATNGQNVPAPGAKEFAAAICGR